MKRKEKVKLQSPCHNRIRTKEKQYLTLPEARANFIEKVTDEVDLEIQIKITHVDQRRLHFRERT